MFMLMPIEKNCILVIFSQYYIYDYVWQNIYDYVKKSYETPTFQWDNDDDNQMLMSLEPKKSIAK